MAPWYRIGAKDDLGGPVESCTGGRADNHLRPGETEAEEHFGQREIEGYMVCWRTTSWSGRSPRTSLLGWIQVRKGRGCRDDAFWSPG